MPAPRLFCVRVRYKDDDDDENVNLPKYICQVAACQIYPSFDGAERKKRKKAVALLSSLPLDETPLFFSTTRHQPPRSVTYARRIPGCARDALVLDECHTSDSTLFFKKPKTN